MTVYVYLDENFDLPLMVEDSAREMARKLGTTTDRIYNAMGKARKGGWRCRFLRVMIEEDE